MSVLSFSVPCSGEQSPTSKVILEEATLMQADCPQQILDSKHRSLDPDQEARHTPNSCAENDTSKECDYASPMLTDEPHNDSHSYDNPLLRGEYSRNKHEQNDCYRVTDSQLTLDCSMSDAKASFLLEEHIKEEGENFMTAQTPSFLNFLHCNGKSSCPELETMSRSSGCALPVKDSNVVNKDNKTDASKDSNSVPFETDDLNGDYNMHPETVPEPMDLAFQTDSEPGNLSLQEQNNEPSTSTNSIESTEKIESESQVQECDQEGESSSRGIDYVEDSTVAIWVKWRGKWQTGFQCPRVDCPLQTLRAKPTTERKKYIAIFFPRKRRYSWADLLLILPISEYPQPLASGTHRKWRKLVKDLTTPRRYIMQKLAVTILNISDQLHTEAVIEDARKASTWKEFAKESSSCRDYSDLGRMLVKLQTMILPTYVTNTWLESSFVSWKQRCQNAHSADSVEILAKELIDSVQWSKVDELWSAPVQPELGPEWRTWKQEAMKYFSTSHPIANGFTNLRQRNLDISASTGGSQIINNKLPKLEVRRAESNASQTQTTISLDIVGPTPISDTEPLNVQPLSEFDASSSNKAKVTAPYQYKQCLAIAAKGQQCGRWATDGDVYCCVHMNSTAVEKLTQDKRPPPDAPMCEGMTTHGHSCKHRARLGSAFCKKHRLQTSHEGKLKGKFSDINALENICNSNDDSNIKECETSMQKNLIPVLVNESNCLMGDSDLRNALPLTTVEASSVDVPLRIEYYGQNIEQSLENTPMCGGVTIHGRSCKHRAQLGSKFCKKHRLQTSHGLSTSSGNNLKRKFAEINTLDNIYSSNASNIGEHETSTQKKLIPVSIDETLVERSRLMQESDLHNALPTTVETLSTDFPRCIGYYGKSNNEQCLTNANKHMLYCDKHIPRFLKRARDGKSRLVSKDVFVNLLEECSSKEQKLYLHRACELLYDFMKRSLSQQKLNLTGNNIMDWTLSEASKDVKVGEYLLKLVSYEKEKITRFWGIGADKGTNELSTLETQERDHFYTETNIKCKLCAAEFSNDQTLGAHWRDNHKKEARWLFRGYACGVCMDSFTNRKVLKSHVNERHGMQFLEHSILLRCMSCNSHYTNLEQLWQHLLSAHLFEFRMQDLRQQSQRSVEQHDQTTIDVDPNNNVSLKEGASHRYTCRFCRLKFDLLPDLGRHHQVAHMNSNSINNQFRGNRYMKHNRHSHPRFKKNFGATYRFKRQTSFGMQKRFQPSNLVLSLRPQPKNLESETMALGRLLESHCSNVAETLFSEMQKTKPRPSNQEILSIARSACCKISLHSILEAKYGLLPENLYLKAAKLCSELNIEIGWHMEEFICLKGCKPLTASHSLSLMKAITEEILVTPRTDSAKDTEWEMDESHYILHPENFNWKATQKSIVLCEDVSFGKEYIPVACVVDENLKDMINSSFLPWKNFTYITKRLIEPSLGLDAENLQLGCACTTLKCSPENCDHVYLFDNDYENAEDIHGKSMRGKFPYDEKGRIILQQGCLVYECNSLCECDAACHNRVLQRGIQVKLEIFKTEKKGWAVRAGEAISRGTFVCEYIGQVLNDEDGTKRAKRYNSIGNSYLYDVNTHGASRGFNDEMIPCVIDATEFGNVSRFICHSCSPNLVNYLVLVESMDCQLAHIGLYANRDIARGEELTYDYCYEQLPGEGFPCYCEAPNCRGRLF